MLHLIPPALVGDMVPPCTKCLGVFVKEEFEQQGQQHMKIYISNYIQKKKKIHMKNCTEGKLMT